MNQKATFDHYLSRSDTAFTAKDYKKSAILVTRAMLTCPNNTLAPHFYGYQLHKHGNDHNAIHYFHEATLIDPKNVHAYIDWSLALNDQKRYEEALRACEISFRHNPNSGEVYQNWGVVLEEQKMYEEAIQKQIKAIELNPRDIYAYINWGVSLRHLGRFDEAMEKYKKILEINPQHRDAHNNWGVILYEQHKYVEAMEKFMEVKSIDPADLYSRVNIGLCYYQDGKENEAKEIFLEGIRLVVEDVGERERLLNVLVGEIEIIQNNLEGNTDPEHVRHAKKSIEGMMYFIELMNEEKARKKKEKI